MKLGVDIGVQYLDKMDQTMGYDTQNVQAGEKIHTKAFTISRWGTLWGEGAHSGGPSLIAWGSFCSGGKTSL